MIILGAFLFIILFVIITKINNNNIFIRNCFINAILIKFMEKNLYSINIQNSFQNENNIK